MIERELIAERTIYAIDKDSRGFEIRLMIGKPYQVSPSEWACPVATVGLHGVYPDMRGIDSWQALMIAERLIHNLLAGFVDDGGRLFWEKRGEDLTVETLFGEPTKTPKLPLTEEEYQERIAALTTEDLQRIDDALMAAAATQFRKVARVVGNAMATEENRIPDYFYASRVRKLVEQERLVSQGNLDFMRRSEVKLPG